MQARRQNDEGETSGSKRWTAAFGRLSLGSARLFPQIPAVVADITALAAVWALLTIVFGPANIHTIWMDKEFTGWVAPIANRLVDGHRLYEEGLHSPMPPMPFVLVRILSQGRATWLTENVGILIFQGLTVLTLFLALSRHLPRPVPLMAALSTSLTFVACWKLILYDILAQFWVAATAAFLCEIGMRSRRRTDRTDRTDRADSADRTDHADSADRTDHDSAVPTPFPLGLLTLAGACTGACVVSKHSTAAGAGLGAVAALLCFPRDASWRRRVFQVGCYGAVSAVSVVVLLLAMGRFVSPLGFVHDVLISGAQTKGGPKYLGWALRGMAGGLIEYAESVLVLIAAMAAVVLIRGRPEGGDSSKADAFDPKRARRLALACWIGALLAFAVAYWGQPTLSNTYTLSSAELDTAFALTCVLLVRHWIFPQASWLGKGGEACLILLVVCFPACAGHQLSVVFLRWAFDNNPVIVVVFAVLAQLVQQALPSGLSRQRAAIAYGLCMLALGFLATPGLPYRCEETRAATVAWPEIPFLAGARLRPAAEELRSMVKRVRGLTEDGDTVLLLPNDPNIEAWIDRPRPRVSSAILFADQYWDRYVDEDLNRLKKDPPKVVIIGPRGYWRYFGEVWQQHTGAERLIDRVSDQLLTSRYEKAIEYPFTFREKRDYMDIYVRKAQSGEPQTEAPQADSN